MKWQKGRRSANVEDRRAARIPGGSAGGLGGLSLLVILIIAIALGMDPTQLLEISDQSIDSGWQESPYSREEQDRLVDFITLVLGDTETTWDRILRNELGIRYREPKLVIFSGSVDSACGYASSATGPFYCSGDEKVYLDLDFFHDLEKRYHAPGDFAQAYVIAHEVGHHIQNIVGTLPYERRLAGMVSRADANQLSVALELQADCYAGVWANQAQNQDLILEAGDIEEGLNAVSSVGDDRIQKQVQGYVVPDSFTHGTSAQRMEWFTRGLESGSLAACDCPEFPPVAG